MRIFSLVALLAFFLVTGPVVAQEASPTPATTPTPDQYVGRQYKVAGTVLVGLIQVDVLAVRYATVEEAQEAFDVLKAEMMGWADRQPREASAPAYGDESFAWTGKMEGITDLSAILVRQGDLIVLVGGNGTKSQPLIDSIPYVEQVIADPAWPDGDLLDIVPDLSEMPPGFTLEQEINEWPAASPTP